MRRGARDEELSPVESRRRKTLSVPRTTLIYHEEAPLNRFPDDGRFGRNFDLHARACSGPSATLSHCIYLPALSIIVNVRT